MRALVTGGAGFIGSHLAEELLKDGNEVCAVDDLSTGSTANIGHLESHPSFRYTNGSVTDLGLMAELVDRCDVIFHLAAVVGVRRVLEDPVRTIEANINGTSAVLGLAREKGKKLVLTSTSEVYGDSSQIPFREDTPLEVHPAMKSRWSYAWSKLIDEPARHHTVGDRLPAVRTVAPGDAKMPKKTRRIVDLSRPIEPSMPVFPLYPKPTTVTWTQTPVHAFDSEMLHLVTHTGTHMDAPNHMLGREAGSIDGIDLNRCIGKGVLLDLRRVPPLGIIDRDTLRHCEEDLGVELEPGDAVLLWTGWSNHWRSTDFLTDYPGLAQHAAQYLADREVALVGVDTANLDHPDAGAFPAHKTLLGKGIPIVENLTRLGAIRSRWFSFVALPLAIAGATGSPVRALAMVER